MQMSAEPPDVIDTTQTVNESIKINNSMEKHGVFATLFRFKVAVAVKFIANSMRIILYVR